MSEVQNNTISALFYYGSGTRLHSVTRIDGVVKILCIIWYWYVILRSPMKNQGAIILNDFHSALLIKNNVIELFSEIELLTYYMESGKRDF